MAWQLHYTSARSGPTGRSGFQFVAATPGLPPGVQAAVTPFMTYRPPPGVAFERLDGHPDALAYDLVGERALLIRCRYLGQDYSGRYGNFFAHAVVAEADELEGLRPIELWQAELWDELPDDGDLAALEDVTPGEAIAPEALADWLAGAGKPGLLTRLVDAVVTTLGRGHGRVVLISEDTGLVARWIAVVSYSLPVPAAARMSFITYSGDPGGAPQRVVGTTPGAWATAHLDDALSINLDGSYEEAASRFAQTVADCWRDSDFAGLDALGELTLVQEESGEPLAALLDRAAALLALCRGEAEGSGAEEDAAAELLTRYGAQVPEWVWPELVPALPGVGFDLALAIHAWARGADAAEVADRCAARCVILALRDRELRLRLPRFALPAEALDRLTPIVAEHLGAAAELIEVAELLALAVQAGVHAPGPVVRKAAARCTRSGTADLPAALDAAPTEWREPLTEGVLAGLAGASEEACAAVLDDATCDLLETRDWTQWPAVGLRVLASAGRRHRDRRLDVTGSLLRLALDMPDVDAVLREVWAVPPTAEECGALLDAYGRVVPRYPTLARLPSRTFARAGAAGLDDQALLRVAAKVRDTFANGDRAAVDAAVVQAYAEAVSATRAEPAARGLQAIDQANSASGAEDFAGDAFIEAALRLGRRDPRFRAALLAAAASPVRVRLVGCWTEQGVRSRWGRSGMPTAQRNELVEVALRLRKLGVTVPSLEDWARGVASKRIAARQLDTHLRDERTLRAALKDLLAEGSGPGSGSGEG